MYGANLHITEMVQKSWPHDFHSFIVGCRCTELNEFNISREEEDNLFDYQALCFQLLLQHFHLLSRALENRIETIETGLDNGTISSVLKGLALAAA